MAVARCRPNAMSVVFEGAEMPLWTFDQLIAIPRKVLKNRALDLRQAVGAERLPPLPNTSDSIVCRATAAGGAAGT